MKSEFLTRVGKVLLGTLGSQLISLGVMLLLVRLYTPIDIGLFNVWLSFATIVTVIVTGRYELALFSGDSKNDTFVIVKLITLVTIFISSIFTLLVLLFGASFESIPLVVRQHAFELGAVIFGLGINKIFLSVLVLQQEFTKLGLVKIILAACIAISQIVAGILAYGVSGLIYGQLFGIVFSSLFIFFWLDRVWLKECWAANLNSVMQSARKYASFPKYSLPADLVSTVASQLPLILIASRFGAESAGWFALTLKMMGAPVTLLASSVLDVFKEQAARDYRMTGNCMPIFKKTFKILALLAFPPFMIFWWLGEWAFHFFFGSEWAESGKYAVLLIPMFYMRFIISPLSYTIYIAQKQKIDLFWQLALLLFTMAIFMLCGEVDTAIYIYSTVYALMYIVYFAISYYCAKGNFL